MVRSTAITEASTRREIRARPIDDVGLLLQQSSAFSHSFSEHVVMTPVYRGAQRRSTPPLKGYSGPPMTLGNAEQSRGGSYCYGINRRSGVSYGLSPRVA
jgi:hypothetical protein